MWIRISGIVLLTLTLGACQSTQPMMKYTKSAANQAADLPKIAQLSDRAICYSYAHSRSKALAKEIERRKLVKASDWSMINKHRVKAGMSECALFAAMGQDECYSVNHTSNQSVYHCGQFQLSVKEGRIDNIRLVQSHPSLIPMSVV